MQNENLRMSEKVADLQNENNCRIKKIDELSLDLQI